MLDFKDWKKTKEDSKSVTMKHDKGHEMTLLLKGIPGVQKEALKRLPLYEGGDIKGVHKSAYDSKDKTLMGESEAGKQTKQMDIRKDAKEKAVDEHNKVLGEMKSQPNPKLKGLAKGGVAHYDEGPPNGTISSSDASDQSDNSNKPVVVNVNTPSPAAQQASTPVNVQQPQVPSSPPVLLPNGSMSAPGAAETNQAAAQGQGNIDAAHAQALIPIEQAKQRAIQLNAQQDQDNINSLRTHAANLDANIKQIDPQAYVKNMSDPKRVATAIGLFLGGAGVPYGGDNFAGKFLNDSINRDVAAQQQNNENQKTIWGAYNTLYNNENLASNMTKASMAQAYSNQVDQVAAQLGTPQAAVNAQKLKSQLAITGNKGILEASGNLSNTQNMPRGGGTGIPQGNSGIQPQTNRGQSPNQDLIDQGIVKGTPSASASEQNQSQQPPESQNNTILTPDALGKVMSMQYGSPQQRANYPEAMKQLTKSQQVEKQIAQINELFPRIRKEATISGNVSSHINPHAVGASLAIPGAVIGGGGLGAISGGTLALPGAAAGAGLGAGVGEGLAHLGKGVLEATGGQKEVQYQTDKAGLEKFIIGALGGNATGQQVNDIVEKNTPSYWDDDETYRKKLTNLKKFLIKSTETSLLDDVHATTK